MHRITREDMCFSNPAGYPTYTGEITPAFPRPPVLVFSAGYLKVPELESLKLAYGSGQEKLPDQVLADGKHWPRVECMLRQKTYFERLDKGWFYFTGESDDEFDVLEGHSPVFLVTMLDDGGWKGGFRFGGIDLVRVKMQQRT